MSSTFRLTLPVLLGASLMASSSVRSGEVSPSCEEDRFTATVTLESDERCTVRLSRTDVDGVIQADETNTVDETTDFIVDVPEGESSSITLELDCALTGNISGREQTTVFDLPTGCGTIDLSASEEITDDCNVNGVIIPVDECVSRRRLIALMRELGFSNNRIRRIINAFDNGTLNLPRRVTNLLDSNLSIRQVANRLSGRTTSRSRRGGGSGGNGGPGGGAGGDGGGPGGDGGSRGGRGGVKVETAAVQVKVDVAQATAVMAVALGNVVRMDVNA